MSHTKKFIKKVIRKLQLIKRWYFPPKLINEIDNTVLKELIPFKEDYLDSKFLEDDLLLKMGLNNEHLEEFPEELYPYTGKGLLLWQYPNQLSKLLVYLAGIRDVKSYMEIGVRFGGNMLLLKRFLEGAYGHEIEVTGVDPRPNKKLKRIAGEEQIIYYNLRSTSQRFKKIIQNKQYDIVFIDGDHSYEVCKQDFELFKDKARYIILHDIISDVCPGVVKVWNEIKANPKYEIIEFVDQYPSCYRRAEKKYLGIGIVKIKD